jgi:hypothetical protein
MNDEVVTLAVQMSSLPAGALQARQTTLEVKAQAQARCGVSMSFSRGNKMA